MAKAEISSGRDHSTHHLPDLATLAVSTPAGAVLILDDGETYIRIRFTPTEAQAVAAKLAPHIP